MTGREQGGVYGAIMILISLILLVGNGCSTFCARVAGPNHRAIRMAVLSHALAERARQHHGEPSPCFVIASGGVQRELARKHAGSSVVVLPRSRLGRSADGVVVDKETGRLGVVLKVSEIDIGRDSSVEHISAAMAARPEVEAVASLVERSGPMGAIFYTYLLKRQAGNWVVVERFIEGVS